MAKTFRFLVTMPATSGPSPVAADVRDEVQYLLSRHMHGVKVQVLKRDERIVPLKMLGPLPIRNTKGKR